MPRPNKVEAGPFRTSSALVIERVAGIEAGVAQTIEEIIVAGRKTAQIDQVAMRAAFAGVQGDARHVLQRVLKIGDALLLDHFGRDHIDDLRRVENLFRQQAQVRRRSVTVTVSMVLGWSSVASCWPKAAEIAAAE